MNRNRLQKIKGGLKRPLTVAVTPQGAKSRAVTITTSFLLFTSLAWLGLTTWAVYVSAQHVDYWRSGLYTQLLKLKVAYLENRIQKFDQKINEVKEVEAKLQGLLQMGNKAAIIQSRERPVRPTGQGGPTPGDRRQLQKTLEGDMKRLSWDDIQKELNHLDRECEKRLENYEKITGWINKERKIFLATPRGWPADGYITSYYGFRMSSDTNLLDFHSGTDIAGPEGTPIKATADGIVALAGWESGYGKMILLNHGLGYSSLYGHLSQTLVTEGEHVTRNQVVGFMGATGRATGTHCHYEVWKNGKTIDPYTYMLAQRSPARSN